MTSTPARPHTRWTVAVAFGVLGSLVVALFVLAFLWPSKTSEAHDLPVGISGSAEAVATFTATLQEAGAPITAVTATDRDDAVRQIETRETYGAIVLPTGAGSAPEVLTAPAASTAATQILTGIASQLQAQLSQQIAAGGGDPSAVQVTVTAVVPLADTDPTGAGLAAAAFPMTLGGMIGGVLISLLVVGAVRRLAALAGFAAGVGILLTLILRTWFGYLPGEFGLIALAIGASILGTSAFIVGCTALIGNAGIGIGAVVTILFANPISAAAVPWQFLAAPWGAIGQFFVPGASAWLLRSVSYFPDADVTKQWLVLGGWIALGVALTLVGHFRARAAMHVPAASLEPAPAA